MTTRNDDLHARLLKTFRAEAEEHVRALSEGLASLERATEDQRAAIVETAFREAHSLKGAARTVSASAIEESAHAVENVFSALKRGETACAPELFENLRRTVDVIAELVRSPQPAPAPAVVAQARGLAEALKGMAKTESPPQAEASEEAGRVAPPSLQTTTTTAGPSGPEFPRTVRIATSRLESLMRHSEELLAATLALGPYPGHLRETASDLTQWRREWARLSPTLRALRREQDLNPAIRPILDFLDWSQAALAAREARLGGLARAAQQDQSLLNNLVRRFLADVEQALLLPLSTLLEGFPKLVRDLSRDGGKQADLDISGGDVEMDRRVLEELKDALVHMVRNCIDHGVESPAERERLGKPPGARIAIRAARLEGDRVEITVSDDGAGVDRDKVKSAARSSGLLTEGADEALEGPALLKLIAESGLTTSPMITSLSGRGLGLAIVREKVERLGGALAMDTVEGRGTTFRIVVPVGLATMRAVFVAAGGQTFAIPAAAVERVARIEEGAVLTVENRETLESAGEVLSLHSLAFVLGLPRDDGSGGRREGHAVVLAGEQAKAAFAVEEVLAEREVLVKGLGPQLVRVRHVTGATVTPTGEVVPVLHPPQLLASAGRGPAPAPKATAPKEKPRHQPRVLVAEDSITSRVLLRNILESAGFSVLVAVDGVDALTTLKTEPVALLVSDVDMPRMNGFDLTVRIRADAKLADLPVVLVTALDSREDRERGIDVGANAYIVKSSFDQSNLLEVVRRLI